MKVKKNTSTPHRASSGLFSPSMITAAMSLAQPVEHHNHRPMVKRWKEFHLRKLGMSTIEEIMEYTTENDAGWLEVKDSDWKANVVPRFGAMRPSWFNTNLYPVSLMTDNVPNYSLQQHLMLWDCAPEQDRSTL